MSASFLTIITENNEEHVNEHDTASEVKQYSLRPSLTNLIKKKVLYI